MIKQEHFDVLKEWAGKHCKKDNPEHSDAYSHLSDAYQQIKLWAKKVQVILNQDSLFKNVTIEIFKRPTDQHVTEKGEGGKVTHYMWARLYPDSTKKDPKIKAFPYCIGISVKNTSNSIRNEGFYVNLGFLEKSKEFTLIKRSPELKKKWENYSSGEKKSSCSNSLSIENGLKLNLDQLAEWAAQSIISFKPSHEEFVNEFSDIFNSKLNSSFNIVNQKDGAEMQKKPLNQILYGPPGTGKTYRTMRLAVDICSETKISDEKLVQEYEKLKKANRISFITFHQSFSYEDFVEGIRPNLNEESENGGISYKIQDGIFKKICQLAKASQGISTSGRNIDISKNKIYKMSLGNSKNAEEDNIYEDCLKNNYVRLGWGGGIDYTECDSISKVETKYKKDRNPEAKKQDFNITAINYLKNEMKKGDLVIISDGNLKFRAIGRISGEYKYLKGNDDYVQMRPVEWLAIFEDSLPVETILSNRLSQMSIYQPNPRSIKIEALERLLNASKQNFVLIIDEINRANISKVFGELITLIEKSKRSSKDNPGLSVTLPYSQVEDFSVPDNLYIIGTMNSADRSIALLDTALRRRFEFKELMPRPELLKNNIGDISLSKLLSKINERIEHLYDRDHTIGHAYLMDDVNDIEGLRNTFRYKIIPLLQEYFYDDWENIRRVLNDRGNFIIERESELDSEVKKSYSISQNEFTEEAFLAIYQ